VTYCIEITQYCPLALLTIHHITGGGDVMASAETGRESDFSMALRFHHPSSVIDCSTFNDYRVREDSGLQLAFDSVRI